MKNISLGIAFLLEIVAFVSFAGLGFLLPIVKVLQIMLCVVLFVALIAFWGLYMAPKAPKKFTVKRYYVSKFMIYSLSAFVIFKTQTLTLGLLFVAAVIVDELSLYKHNLS